MAAAATPLPIEAEAGIAAEPRAERGVTDKTEADRGDDRPEHAACRRVQDTRSHDDCEIRPDRERKRAQTNRRHREPRDQPRRAHGIDQRAAGHLTGQRDEAARGQDQADIELRPLMRGQIDRNERTKAGLDVREEEGEPVETARTCLRRRTRVSRAPFASMPPATEDRRRRGGRADRRQIQVLMLTAHCLRRRRGPTASVLVECPSHPTPLTSSDLRKP